MRILSLNTWGGARYDALADWLPGTDADVVCLQEVTRTASLGRVWTTFTDGERTLPQRANLFDDVAALLPGHRGVFVASDAGPVTTSAGTHRQEFGIAVLVRDGVSVVGHDTAFVHGDFTESETWATGDRPRVAHAVRLVEPAGPRPGHRPGRRLTVIHLHGLRDPAGKGDTPARLAQAERLAALVARARRPGDLAVVCGDLNLLPGSATFEVLGALGLVDLVGTADTRTSLYRKPVRHASYLLVSDPAAVRGFTLPAEPEVSDHRALLLDL